MLFNIWKQYPDEPLSCFVYVLVKLIDNFQPPEKLPPLFVIQFILWLCLTIEFYLFNKLFIFC